MVDVTRRLLLRGRAPLTARVAAARAPLRPPWALADAAAFEAACTRCGDCVRACPQAIVCAGDGGFPELSYAAAGCTFCADCVRACPTSALDRSAAAAPDALPRAQTARAHVGDDCLALRRIECRVCGEHCDYAAIRFRPRAGGVARPEIDPARCTGCGECVAPCPATTISILDKLPLAV